MCGCAHPHTVVGLNPPATMKEGAEGKMKGRKLSSITENGKLIT